MNKIVRTMALGIVVVAALVACPGQAYSRGFLSLGVGVPIGGYCGPSYYVPGYYATQVQQVLVTPGHYETRTETVLVAPAHYETRVTPAIERTMYDKYGWPQTVVVQPARTEQVLVPDRFEARTTQVFIPPVYASQPVQVYVPGYYAGGGYYSGASVFVGGRFRL
ncbi:MAG: hypothetical protein NTV86_02340 [Planctomycetota bacterium]|nr:hypothetical protein [Planctomycetota bacterium]